MFMFRHGIVFLKLIVIAIGLAWLTSCSTLPDIPAPVIESRKLLALGKTDEAFQVLEKAHQAQPTNTEIKTSYLLLRERLLALKQQEALVAIQKKDWVAAEAAYRFLLRLGKEDLALQGIKKMESQKRVDQWVGEAKEAWNNKKVDEARSKLRQAMAENSQDIEAVRLLKQMDAQKQNKLEEALNRTITLQFQDASLRSVLQSLAKGSSLNFVLDKDVSPDLKVTVFLKNTTVERAIKTILMTTQLDQRVLDDHSILIYPNEPAKQKDYMNLMVKSFYLNNADVKLVANSLRSLLKIRDMVIDEKLNMLIIRDTHEVVRQAEKIVAMHDMADPEVMLEVEVLEVKRTKLFELGVNLPKELTLTPLETTLVSTGTTTDSGTISTSTTAAFTLKDLARLSGGRTAVSSSGVLPSVTAIARRDLTDAVVLANPRIRVRNKEKAMIKIGERVPNVTTTLNNSFASESISYIDVGLKLEVEPNIYLDSEVAIKLSLEVSNILEKVKSQNSQAYRIGTRNANTVLRLKDGENQILGGLINENDQKSASRIPGLGDLPMLGRIFGSQSDSSEKTELVLSITPHIVRSTGRPGLDVTEFESGPDSLLRGRLADQTNTSGDTSSAAAPGQVTPAATSTPTDRGESGIELQQPRNTVAPASTSAVQPSLMGIIPWNTAPVAVALSSTLDVVAEQLAHKAKMPKAG